MSASAFAEQIVRDFITNITDHVFLSIEQDDAVMREYMTNVNHFGLEEMNRAIGLRVKDMLQLDHVGEEHNPRSRLIKSFTKHKK